MLRSFRSRLVATVIALVAVTALLVGGLGYLLVERSLRSQLVDDAVARTRFNVTELATTEVLPADADREQFAATGLLPRFVLRGTDGVFVDFGDGEPFVSSLDLVEVPSRLSPELRALVESGEIGYQFAALDGEPVLFIGARRPDIGPDFYFEYSAAEVDRALTELRRVLLGAGLGVAALGALVAGLIARTVARPIRAAASGAHRMAEGDLEVRLAERGGDEIGALAVAFNEMAGSLQQKIAELEESRARERRFVADVSHELRTPLTALVNEAAILAPHLGALPAEPRLVGEMLVGDVGRLRRLVEELLEVSRLDTAVQPPETAAIDLDAFLAAVIAERNPEASLTVAGEHRITVDRIGLERVVANLLDNARTHAPGAAVAVDASVDEAELVLTVTDAGPGVPEAVLPYLFDRFYMVDPARRGGTGLGLAIAARHATRMGAALTARGGDGGIGMVFELRAPVTAWLPGGDGDETSPTEPEDVIEHDVTGETS
ncbi:HAMP domain-containing sensor histidine kinase [soil metagenome]